MLRRQWMAMLVLVLAGMGTLAVAEEIAVTRGTQTTYVASGAPDDNFGASPMLLVGSGDDKGKLRGLIRFDLIEHKGHGGELNQAVLELTLADVRGEWTDQAIDLYRVGADNAGWAAGFKRNQVCDRAACWNYRAFSTVKHVKTGEAMHAPWAGKAGLAESGKDYHGAKLASATVSSADKGQVVRWVISDPGFLKEWIAHPDRNAGFLLIAPGLEGGLGGAAFNGNATGAGAPALKLNIDNYTPPPGVLIKYTLPKQGGDVSIIIRNGEGAIVRELLHGARREPGERTELWDGKNDKGEDLPAGEYSWKLLHSQGLSAEYLFTLGLSVDHWKLWPGNHIPALGVAVDDSGVYAAAGCSEVEGMCIKMTPEGERLWTMTNFWFDHAAWQGGHSAGVDGKYLYLLQENYKIQRLSSKEGWTKKDGPYTNFRCQWDVVWDPKDPKRPGAPDPDGWSKMKGGVGRRTAAIDMAVRNGVIVVSYEHFGAIRFVDPESPDHKRDGYPVPAKYLFEAKVKQPIGVAVDNAGRALVITEGRVVAIEKGNPEPVEVIPAARLETPYRLDVHPVSGEIYVAERGDSQQVKIFSPEGELVKALGKKGGRPEQGLYEGEIGFLNINDIAVASDGTFWFTEAFNAPRRTAHWSPETGLIKEWYGGQMYANRAFADRADPTLVWMDSQWGEVIQAKVDYEKKTWTVRATYNYMYPLKGRYRHENGMWFVRHLNGQTYLANENGVNVMRLDEAGRRLIPCASLGTAYYPGGNAGWRIPERFKPDNTQFNYAEAKQRDPGDKRSHEPWSYAWHDADGDGEVEQAEFTFHKELRKGPHVNYVDEELNYYTTIGGSWKDHGKWTGTEKKGIGVIKPLRFTEAGAPVYDWENFTQPFGESGGFRGCWVDKKGNLFAHYNEKVMKYTRDSGREWSVGIKGKSGALKPGEVNVLYRPIGTAHGCFAVTDIHNSICHVWDTNGLWVGRLLDNPVITSEIPPEAYEICGENFGGSLYENPETGEVLFYAGGGNSTPVYRVTGFDQFRYQDGSVEWAPATAKASENAE